MGIKIIFSNKNGPSWVGLSKPWPFKAHNKFKGPLFNRAYIYLSPT